ncbi:MAG TPA: DUF356 domain-containing protein [Methanothermobacter sp.]|jgi:hypothetical protein|uniref:DUF356 domain-containing protein n=1 Tax=Methanothermobacter tenebrarum TaxID=680118 RepID=A0ABN6PDV8_9EURY|nr:DUF356 domain-containing protein [Methanothermobacter tenebrarum]MDD3455075.1 DUF356 domain-containing protein [Methanobacteriales archaeon]MDI6881624.1 DUF356 domain-containing protein [Methanothermobacter sp.]MDX9693534.1 DUF356 domain-containing protein [Methanothermobacter sp.]BDH79405.1 hypothetical protein MTTB_07840 [Methanothermobacter tenebrarum]HHW16074.1 DUF356 domain-containing protein [Methanothermobacter sp.]
MALILIRADNKKKLLNALADLERHANLKIRGKPRLVDNRIADKIVSSILGGEVKRKSSMAVAVNVEEDDTTSIMRIKDIHPPAHVIVVSGEYPENKLLGELIREAPIFRGYYSHKRGF